MLGNVYIYLIMDDKHPICYWCAPASQFTNPNPTYRWINFIADKALGTVMDDFEAGIIQIKLCINDVTRNGRVDFSKYDSWKHSP
jgi:hypothetical protein